MWKLVIKIRIYEKKSEIYRFELSTNSKPLSNTWMEKLKSVFFETDEFAYHDVSLLMPLSANFWYLSKIMISMKERNHNFKSRMVILKENSVDGDHGQKNGVGGIQEIWG